MFLGLVGGKEREVLPPHVARELRDVLLVADAQVHNNYAATLAHLKHFEEAKALWRKTIPAARRVLGEEDNLTLKMRRNYATAFYADDSATLDDLRESVTMLEELERIIRRVLGGVHPLALTVVLALEQSRDALAARESGAS